MAYTVQYSHSYPLYQDSVIDSALLTFVMARVCDEWSHACDSEMLLWRSVMARQLADLALFNPSTASVPLISMPYDGVDQQGWRRMMSR